MSDYKNSGMIRQTDNIEDQSKKGSEIVNREIQIDFIVPPGLIQKMYEFHALIETSQLKPILITGPTGVGKSLFIHMYREWFKRKKNQNCKINIVNCSHFEKNLARSELFGHVKGAFTGANNNKAGWISDTDGGLLILEEIGELSEDCQAQLLTLIENGYYHRVGENITKKVKDLTFIGATNKETIRLRPDFWNRFLTFDIPPIHKRRGDILYYIAAQYPEMIKELKPRETLLLLAYNWPGNVREINRVISSLKARKFLRKNNLLMGTLESEESEFHYLVKEYTDLSLSDAEILFDDLLKNKVNVIDLERILNRFYIGLYEFNKSLYFNNIEQYDWKQTTLKEENDKTIHKDHSINKLVLQMEWLSTEEKLMKREKILPLEKEINNKYESIFNVHIMPQWLPFSNALYGYHLFCGLFFQDYDSDHNCINVSHHNWPQTLNMSYKTILHDNLGIFEKILKQCFEYRSGITLPKDIKIPLDFKTSSDFYFQLYKDYPRNKFLTSINFEREITVKKEADIDIFIMTEKEFTKYYYEGLLKRYPTTRKIAEALGIKEQTLYSKLRSLKREGVIS